MNHPMNHIEIHNKIDTLLKAGPGSAVVTDIKALLAMDFDTRKYFFAQSDETWLEWLLDNGFLEVVKAKAEDSNPTSFSYQTPELDFLVRVAEKRPAEVTDIMLSVDVPSSFNPEVIDRFVWICSKLPADQVARMAPKIKNEEWVPLMKGLNRWGFEYKSMFEKLSPDKDGATIVTLASVVLSIKPEEKTDAPWRTDSPFYFQQITDTGVFEHLLAITGIEVEEAFTLVAHTLGKIASQGGAGQDPVFPIDDSFHLYDVDFFELAPGNWRNISTRDDVRSLATAMKALTERIIGGNCENDSEVRRLYRDTIASLPDAHSMWRLRLFVWSQCPIIFKEELMSAFTRAFDYENNWPIVSGAEYEWAIKTTFKTLPKKYRDSYIKQALEYYGKKEMRLRSSGYDILSSIPEDLLTKEEKDAAETLFGAPLNPSHKPEPSIKRAYASVIVPEGVLTEQEFSELTIEEIIEGLKGKWSPESLAKADTPRDMFHPKNAEGMGTRLQNDMKGRLGEYLKNAPLFFDRTALDPHYTYAFMRGFYDAYKTSELPKDTDWEPLMLLFSAISKAAAEEKFSIERHERFGLDGWISGWNDVHRAMADLVRGFLGEDDVNKAIPFDIYRDRLLVTISYLLRYPNPDPEEHTETAGTHPTTGKIEYKTSDPFSTAINSVRGRTFQSLTQFVYRDSPRIKEATGADALSNDVKEIYESTLANENTEAVMFMFGHYLASYYYRDVAWIDKLMTQIFPKDKTDLFLASWEGYIASNLYDELFVRLEPLYEYAIELDSASYTPRRYFKDLDEGLAIHLALAYMHFDEFTTDSTLFKSFWNAKNVKRHEEFVSFVGRHSISRESAKAWDQEHAVNTDKLEVLWDWLLSNCNEASVFAEFGFWISTKEAIFEEKWVASHLRQTLEKSKGRLNWEYGAMQSLPTFASIAPEDTVAILRSYLTATELGPQYRAWTHIDEEMIGIFRTLYKNPATRDSTYALIDELLPRGAGQFWRLKEALD